MDRYIAYTKLSPQSSLSKKAEMESRNALNIIFSFIIIPILIFFISSHSLFHQAQAIKSRQNLEIIIGGGGYSSPPDYSPSPEYCPEPPPPPEPVCPSPVPIPAPSPPPIIHPPPPPPPIIHPPPPPPPPRTPTPKPPTPPKKPPSPMQPPQPIELQRAIQVIQRFKPTITKDPFNILKTWKGRICEGSNYKGFKCDTTIRDNKTRVVFVNFNGFEFSGDPTKPLALNNFLDGLTDLVVFHANSNSFHGTVPTGISKLPTLYELDLSNNNLAGEFPRPVLTADLTFLDLRFNALIGEVPPKAFTLDLDVLYLNNNHFIGNIPDNLGQTPALYVTLANNNFTGTIPKSIGQAQTLLEILLLNNHLSGCLPYEIGLMKKLTLFDASLNYLTGPIPNSFGCMKSLAYLNLSYNKFYGTVPEPLCRIPGIETVTLKHNYITEVGPECRKLIMKKKLDVSENCIRDLPSQRSKRECADFFSKPQSCPDPESMNVIPCKMDYSASDKKSRKLIGQPRTYAVLKQHA